MLRRRTLVATEVSEGVPQEVRVLGMEDGDADDTARSTAQPVLVEEDHKDNMRAVSYSYARKQLGAGADGLHDWATMTLYNHEDAMSVFKRVLRRFVYLIDEGLRSGSIDQTFANQATVDILSIGQEVLAFLDTRQILNQSLSVEQGMADSKIDSLLSPVFSHKVLMDGSQGVCYTELLKPSTSIGSMDRMTVHTMTLSDRGRRKLHPRMNRFDNIDESGVRLLLSGWDARDLPISDVAGRNHKVKYELDLRMSVTGNNGHYMVAFDMEPHAENFDGYSVRDMIIRSTTLRVMSSTENDKISVPFYVENGGVLRGRVVLHIFCGVSLVEPSTLSLSNAAPAGGHDTAACLMAVLDGVTGLLVTAASQAGGRAVREKKIRVQRGTGSFYPAHVATMIGNLFGTPVTHYEAHHMATIRSTLLTMGAVDYITPEQRVGEFLVMCSASSGSGQISEEDKDALKALISLSMGVQIYNQLVRYYGGGGEAPTVDEEHLDKLTGIIARAGSGRKRGRMASFIRQMATVQYDAILAPVDPVASPNWARELRNLGTEIIRTLKETSLENHYSPSYREVRTSEDSEEESDDDSESEEWPESLFFDV